jgi:hypothetical protein
MYSLMDIVAEALLSRSSALSISRLSVAKKLSATALMLLCSVKLLL